MFIELNFYQIVFKLVFGICIIFNNKNIVNIIKYLLTYVITVYGQYTIYNRDVGIIFGKV